MFPLLTQNLLRRSRESKRKLLRSRYSSRSTIHQSFHLLIYLSIRPLTSLFRQQPLQERSMSNRNLSRFLYVLINASHNATTINASAQLFTVSGWRWSPQLERRHAVHIIECVKHNDSTSAARIVRISTGNLKRDKVGIYAEIALFIF